MTNQIQETLKERGSRYGVFAEQAEIEQTLTTVLRARKGWDRLEDDQRSAVEMICVKLARIVNGDPDYDDNWRDISGYATLIVNRLAGGPST